MSRTEHREVTFSSNLASAEKAADRYEQLNSYISLHTNYSRNSLLMDLTAADGVNGNLPLDWERLLAADDFNFFHDVGGIRRHMNRFTGKLGNSFTPRFTLKETA